MNQAYEAEKRKLVSKASAFLLFSLFFFAFVKYEDIKPGLLLDS